MLPSTSQLIKKYGLDAKKSLGQNFILDKNFTDKIAKCAQNLQDFEVLEIGPGPGSLTRSILDAGAKKLTVIEKDARCIELLKEIQAHYGSSRLEIINADALKIDENEIFSHAKKIKIISNLPYNIGTNLVLKWLKEVRHAGLPVQSGRHAGLPVQKEVKIDEMILMLQKEVVERIVAKCNTNNYGRLAIICNFLAKTEMLFEVNRAIFTPPPKVTSAIVRIAPYEKPLFDIETAKLEKLTASAFNQRRKMLKSSLKNYVFHDKIEKILEKCQISGDLRPQNLTIEDFCKLAKNS